MTFPFLDPSAWVPVVGFRWLGAIEGCQEARNFSFLRSGWFPRVVFQHLFPGICSLVFGLL